MNRMRSLLVIRDSVARYDRMPESISLPSSWLRILGAAVGAVLILTTGFASAADFSNVQFLTGGEVLTQTANVNLQGGPFPYNTMNDDTGAKLETPDGGYDDFYLSGNSLPCALGSVSLILNPSSAQNRIRATHGFTGATPVNNPGSLNNNTFTLLFADHLKVTHASFNFSSLNTAGISWEYSVIQFLDVNGEPFNPLTGLNFIPGVPAQYLVGDTIGFSGQAGVGNWVSASKGTVKKVGSDNTSTGSNGANNDVGNLNYTSVSLAAGTRIGGIRWSTYLEDVRGKNNGTTSLTSSLLDFTISGRIEPPISVHLYSLKAESVGDKVLIEWEMSADETFAGFNLLRSGSETESYVRVNAELITDATLRDHGILTFRHFDMPVSTAPWFYRIEEIGLDGAVTLHGPVAVRMTVGIAEQVMPKRFELAQNFPNPFNPTTAVTYSLPEATHVMLTVYDLSGRAVRTLVSGVQPAGRYTMMWDARNNFGEPVAGGVYLYRLVAGEFVQAHKMTLLR